LETYRESNDSKEVNMLQYTGHPLVDVGVATITTSQANAKKVGRCQWITMQFVKKLQTG